jgi:putative transposase
LSASTVARLKEVWADEHARWLKRDLSVKRYVYFWVDGIYVHARLEDEAQCLLVIIGATPEGKKELVGLADGLRESAHSGRGLLLDLKRRGLSSGPQLAVGDGALGFWKALDEVWPTTRAQRCWVHKTALERRLVPTDCLLSDALLILIPCLVAGAHQGARYSGVATQPNGYS